MKVHVRVLGCGVPDQDGFVHFSKFDAATVYDAVTKGKRVHHLRGHMSENSFIVGLEKGAAQRGITGAEYLGLFTSNDPQDNERLVYTSDRGFVSS